MSVQTHLALQFNVGKFSNIQLVEERLPVVEARNRLALAAVREADAFPFVPREILVAWVDDDAWFSSDVFGVMAQIFAAAKQFDAVCGYFSVRRPHAPPAAFRHDHSPPRPGVDCAPGSVVPIARAGFHFFVHRLSVLDKLGPEPFGSDANTTTEDFHFCDRMTAAGLQIGCAVGVPVAHIDAKTGAAFLPGESALLASGNELRSFSQTFATPDGIEHQVDNGRQHGLGEAALNDAVRSDPIWERRRMLAGLS